MSLTKEMMKKGGRYNWRHDPDTKLVYLGHNWSGNGHWHQFAKIGTPRVVWCEVQDNQLAQFEETPSKCTGAFSVIKDRNHTGEEVIDTVFGKSYEAREMRDSLVDHDGYDSDIIVRRACGCSVAEHPDHQFPAEDDDEVQQAADRIVELREIISLWQHDGEGEEAEAKAAEVELATLLADAPKYEG